MVGLYRRSERRQRLPTPCDSWRFTAAPRGCPQTDSVLHVDEDLEPVYATISEITDNMDASSTSPAGRRLFHGLLDVFADLAALDPGDAGDGSSLASSSASPPPTLTDAPPPRRATVPQPIPGRVGDRRPYVDGRRQSTTSSARFVSYC